jgi:2-methoxy-6-polyprenyl-1,4-benzoquinol methylase
LDVAGGTGDIAFRIFNNMQGVKKGAKFDIPPQPMPLDIENIPLEGAGVIVSDINAHMLRVGQQRACDLGIAGCSHP